MRLGLLCSKGRGVIVGSLTAPPRRTADAAVPAGPGEDRLVVIITWEEALLVIGFKSPRVCRRFGRLPFFHDEKSTVLVSQTWLPIR